MFDEMKYFHEAISKGSFSSIEPWLLKTDSKNLEARFSIYSNGFDIRSRESLEEMYPKTSQLLGQDLWNSLGSSYCSNYKKWESNLNRLGSEFPDHLLENGVDEKWVHFARFELHIWQIFHEPWNRPRFELKAFEKNPKFRFQKTLTLFEADYRVATCWKSGRSQDLCIEPEKSRLSRSEYGVCVRIIQDSEFDILKRLLKGMTFNDALEGFSEEPLVLSEILKSWIEDQLIIFPYFE